MMLRGGGRRKNRSRWSLSKQAEFTIKLLFKALDSGQTLLYCIQLFGDSHAPPIVPLFL